MYGHGTGGVSGSPPYYEKGLMSYGDLAANYVDVNGYTRGWNDVSKVPYLTGHGSFISYDDEQSIALKVGFGVPYGALPHRAPPPSVHNC